MRHCFGRQIKVMMIALWITLWCTVIEISKVTSEPDVILEIEEDHRRPIWNVAHMVNALYQVDYYLDQGANSLEFDVSFDWEGNAKFTFHGIPCDCFRSCIRYEDFITYINYMRQITTPGTPQYRERLVMLFMDVKVHGLTPHGKIRAGEDIATKLLDHYWMRGSSGARAYILISVPSINHISFVDSLRRKLRLENFTHYDSKLGFDFSGNEDLDSIHYALKSSNIADHVWQGDGITNCLPRGTTRLRDAIRRRDHPRQEVAFIDKVYWWTVDKMSTMRTTLRMGVDGMITNYPDRLITVLNENEFSQKFRLATYKDNPWTKHATSMASLINEPEARTENFTDFEDELLYNC